MKRATIPAWSAIIFLALAVQSCKQIDEVKDLPASTSQEIIAKSGVKGGLIVHLGKGEVGFTTDSFLNDSFLVHGLYRDEAAVVQARIHIKKKDLYGKVSVQHWDKDYLPYADNMVNLLVAEELGDIPIDEVMRVLTPLGAAFIKSHATWTKKIKPWPEQIDEWTHYLHDADNNAVAQDMMVGLPRHLQWVGEPKYARSHEQLASVSAMVSAKGRLFYIVDEGLRSDIRMPARWRLVARDAFNGVILWKRQMDKWTNHLHSFRSGPPDLPFRLVAVGDRVYVTLGEDKLVTALDAATGKNMVTYPGSEQTRQIIHTGEMLIMLVGDSQVVIQSRHREIESARREILASNPDTGAILWRKKLGIDALIPMVASNGALLYQTNKQLVCLELKSGNEQWRKEHPVHFGDTKKNKKLWQWVSPTLTAHEDIVYVADFRRLSAVSINDGEVFWSNTSARGFNSPPDIFVINDLLWRGYTRTRGAADFGEGLNAKTGVLEMSIATKKAWEYPTLAHYRCYRPKATNRFILSSRSGIEFINIESGKIDLNHWVRGTCQYGVLPANGLLYAPPHSCACNIKTMVRGICALASERNKPSITMKSEARLKKGTAYGKITQEVSNDMADDWPTYRHDNERSGRSTTRVPTKLRQGWEAKIGGRLSSPVSSNGRIFIAAVDAHMVYSLSAENGTILWSYTADGRVDSPPTIYHNMVLFGSTDGWIYCLRASDGMLAWRFRAAPEERRIVMRGQLESAWPVPGNVLVYDGELIAAAGRSSYLDGGIYVYRIEPETGKVLSETVVHSLDPKTGGQPDGGVDLRGVLNDILAVSGGSVYMRHLKIDFETGDDLEIGPPHLFAPMGFLDDHWWHRSYWLYGSDAVCMPPMNESGWQIWPRMGNMVPSGRILSVSGNTVYGYGRDKYHGGHAGQFTGGEKYHLFATEKEAFEPLPSNRNQQHLRYARSGIALGLKRTKRDNQHGSPSLHSNLWSQQVPIFVRALALADTTLILAGPPELSEMRSTNLVLENPDNAEAAFLGRYGAALLLVDAIDGKQIAKYDLASSPVFDGMIAAQGRIFASLENGSLVCFAK
jgi:outer membrane protein assembly factor BamB